jgi:peptidoglycan/LPS O-acetylase OafA/YrhL
LGKFERMKFRPEIEGLRALAVLLVVLSHFGFKVFEGGYIGVDIFFIISGFLITTLICNEFLENVANLEYQKIFSIKNFYLRRIKRIIPLSIFVIITIEIAARFILNPEQANSALSDAFWSSIFLANLHFINNATNYFASGTSVSPFQHFWTLSVEEQFYLVMPALVFLQLSQRGKYLLGRRIRWKGRVLIIVIPLFLISFAFSCIKTYTSPAESYFSSYTRAWELGLGVILAIFLNGNQRYDQSRFTKFMSPLGFFLILFSALLFDANTPMPGYLALLPTLGACCVIFGATFTSNFIIEMLKSRPVTFIGRISYSIYLWHWPLLILLCSKYPKLIHSYFLRLLLIFAVILISYLTFQIIEKPFRNIKLPALSVSKRKKYILKRIFFGGSFLAILIVSIGISFLSRPISSYESKVDSQVLSGAALESKTVTRVLAQTRNVNPIGGNNFINLWKKSLLLNLTQKTVPGDLNPPLNNLRNQSEYWRNCFAKNNTVPCSYGNSNAEPQRTAIVYGDSYAISILPSILGSLDLSKWRVDVLTFGECMISDVTPLHNGKEVSGCNNFRTWAWSYIREHPHSILFATDNPDVSIQGASGETILIPGSSGNTFWAKQFKSSISNLIRSQELFVMIGQPPQPVQSLGQCVSNTLQLSPECYAKIQSRSAARALEKSIFQTPSSYYFDLQDVLCVGQICPPIIGNTPVFLDGSHLSFELAVKLSPYFKEQLAKNPIFNRLTQ